MRVAGTAVRASATHLLDRHGVGDGGEQGKGESPLTLENAFRSAQVGRGCAVGARATGEAGSTSPATSTNGTISVCLILDCLDLAPLQFQQALQVLLKLIHGSGSGHIFALCVEKHSQLPQAPSVEGRWQEVRVALTELALLLPLALSLGDTAGPLELYRVDDLCSQVQIGWGGRGRRHRCSLSIRQIAGTV